MSEETIEDLVAENLKVRVVLKESANSDGEVEDITPMQRAKGDSQPPFKYRDTSLPQLEKEEYTYHYGRIVSAVALLMGLLIILTYVTYDATQMHKRNPDAVEALSLAVETAPSNTEEDGDAIASVEVASMPTESAVEAQSDAPMAPEVNPPSEAVISAEIEAEVAMNQQSATSDLRVADKLSVSSGDSSLQADVTSEETVSLDSAVKLEETVSLALPKNDQPDQSVHSFSVTAGNASTEDLQQSVVVDILSQDVVMSQMSAKISGRKPVGQLLRSIDLGDPPFQKVYIFSTISNRAGETIVYRWYLNDRLSAEVPVLVRRNDRWRSYSSKNINGQMTGDWRVEVVDSREAVLLKAHFRVNEWNKRQ